MRIFNSFREFFIIRLRFASVDSAVFAKVCSRLFEMEWHIGFDALLSDV